MHSELDFRPVQLITSHVIYKSPYKYWPDENGPFKDLCIGILGTALWGESILWVCNLCALLWKMIFTPTPRSIYLEIAQKRFKTILKSYLKFFNALAEVLKSFQNFSWNYGCTISDWVQKKYKAIFCLALFSLSQ